MNKKLKYIGICLVIIIATAFVIGYISQIFVSKDNPPSEEKLKQNHDYIIISEQVFRYNKELPKSIGNGFNLVHVKYDADVNSLIFSIEGSDTITYEQLQKILPQIKSHTILKLQNALEMKSDPLIMSVVDAGASIRYIMTADTLNFEFEISPEELKSNPALGKEPLAIEYLKEYEQKINTHMPDIDSSGEGMLKVKYDADDNNLIWYCLTTCNESQADDAYNQTLLNLKETYRNRTDAVVDAIVESNGKTQFIYQDSKGKVVFSFVITGNEISNK